MLWCFVQGDLEPGEPIAITFPARSEAIDAPPGAERGPPRVVPDETKLAVADCASRGFAVSRILGAVGHCRLLLALSQNFPIFPLSLLHAVSSRSPTHPP